MAKHKNFTSKKKKQPQETTYKKRTKKCTMERIQFDIHNRIEDKKN